MITKVWAVINQRARLSRPVIFNCTGAPKCLPRRGLGSASCKELAAAALQTVHRHRPGLWAHTAAVSPLSWGRSHSTALQTCPSPPLHRDGGRTSQLCVPEGAGTNSSLHFLQGGDTAQHCLLLCHSSTGLAPQNRSVSYATEEEEFLLCKAHCGATAAGSCTARSRSRWGLHCSFYTAGEEETWLKLGCLKLQPEVSQQTWHMNKFCELLSTADHQITEV